MLRSILADFLSKAEERQLDVPLLLLLPTVGFRDVHLVHGSSEFGKDIIAKTDRDDAPIQYVFQCKAGDIRQKQFRNEVLGQLLEATTVALAHPSFDHSIPRQVVLLTTGELKGNAALALQDFNRSTIPRISGALPVEFWGGQDLLDHFESAMGRIVYHQAPHLAENLGQFYQIYGSATGGRVTPRQIEAYSRQWSGAFAESDELRLSVALESSLISLACKQNGLIYEYVYVQLALLRSVIESCYSGYAASSSPIFRDAVRNLSSICEEHIEKLREQWDVSKDLISISNGTLDITTYLVQCSRIMEFCSIAYFTEEDPERRSEIAAFFVEFLNREPGCAHPLSDNYSVTIAFATILLVASGNHESALKLVKNTAVWLLDRHEQGNGLAGIEADENLETATLLGSAFSFIDLPIHSGALLATVLVDLAAFLRDSELYENLVGDFGLYRIVAEYWQPPDTEGACSLDATDVIHYASLRFSDHLPLNEEERHAAHLRHEPSDYTFVRTYGSLSAMLISLLLRDRYFPRIWLQLVSQR